MQFEVLFIFVSESIFQSNYTFYSIGISTSIWCGVCAFEWFRRRRHLRLGFVQICEFQVEEKLNRMKMWFDDVGLCLKMCSERWETKTRLSSCLEIDEILNCQVLWLTKHRFLVICVTKWMNFVLLIRLKYIPLLLAFPLYP